MVVLQVATVDNITRPLLIFWLLPLLQYFFTSRVRLLITLQVSAVFTERFLLRTFNLEQHAEQSKSPHRFISILRAIAFLSGSHFISRCTRLDSSVLIFYCFYLCSRGLLTFKAILCVFFYCFQFLLPL